MTLIAGDYFESRSQFKASAQAAGARLSSFPLESLSGTAEPLSVDVALLGHSTCDAVIVIMSGVHGVEGYAGAACIRQLLRDYHARYARPGLAFLLIHALNPWGFAHDCRVTEQNVDLNRNFIDFAKLPSSSQYAKYHAVLCQHYRPGLRGLANEMRLILAVLGRKRRRRFQEGVTAGQYKYRDGLFYGGVEPTPNHRIWNQIMAAHLRPDQHVRFLDIHTGLGRKGHGFLITHLAGATPRFETLNRWLDNQLTSFAGCAAVSAALEGPLPAYVEKHLGDRCFAFTLEFGVAAAFSTLNAMRADHWLRLGSGRAPAALRTRIRQRFRDAFLARESGWERAVLERFEWTVHRLISSLSPHDCDHAAAPAAQKVDSQVAA